MICSINLNYIRLSVYCIDEISKFRNFQFHYTGGVIMAITFKQMVAEARDNVQGISSADAREKINANPETLVIDVQDAADAGACGLIPSSLNISLGMLPIRADL